MKKPNKTCMVCGKQYYYCPHCDEQYHLPRWLGLFHDENCKTIFNTVSDYAQKVISLEKAKEILDKCDLSNKDIFNKKIIELLDSIYGGNKEPENSETITINETITEVEATAFKATTVENAENIEKLETVDENEADTSVSENDVSAVTTTQVTTTRKKKKKITDEI